MGKVLQKNAETTLLKLSLCDFLRITVNLSKTRCCKFLTAVDQFWPSLYARAAEWREQTLLSNKGDKTMNTLAKMLVECTKCNMAQGGQKWSKMVTVKMVKSLLRRTNWRIGESECLDLFSHTFNLLQTQVNTQRCVMHPFAVLLCNQMYFTCSLIFNLHHV
jgi:hypothetical protein